MHPLLLHPRGLAAYLLAWAVAAGALSATLHAQALGSWLGLLLWAVPLSLWMAFAALSLYPLCRVLPLQTQAWGRALAVRAAALGGLSAATVLLALGWNAAGPLIGLRQGLVALPDTGWLALGVGVLVMFVLATLAHDVLVALRRAQAAAAGEAEARVLAREMELQLLRLQVDPHFLFNALNAISALTHLDPPAAREMTVQLAHFFRQTLAMGQHQTIRLEQELALVEHYLFIERQRLGDRLQVTLQADAAARAACLPPLSLQPLVENALKHGLRQIESPGHLTLQARVQGDWLLVRLTNPVPTAPGPTPAGLGLGLRNVKERLTRLHGPQAQLRVRREPGLFAVEISLPYITEMP